MTAGIAILVQGMLFLRRRNYEVFLILHIVLAAVLFLEPGSMLTIYIVSGFTTLQQQFGDLIEL